jgi:hypothetical protein
MTIGHTGRQTMGIESQLYNSLGPFSQII